MKSSRIPNHRLHQKDRMIGLYLPKPIFPHGKLYVAISRVKSSKDLRILILDDEGGTYCSTTNVVYRE
ncbi:hypothetical protein CR513_42823, partial [Mucuna pruriens]